MQSTPYVVLRGEAASCDCKQLSHCGMDGEPERCWRVPNEGMTCYTEGKAEARWEEVRSSSKENTSIGGRG